MIDPLIFVSLKNALDLYLTHCCLFGSNKLFFALLRVFFALAITTSVGHYSLIKLPRCFGLAIKTKVQNGRPFTKLKKYDLYTTTSMMETIPEKKFLSKQIFSGNLLAMKSSLKCFCFIRMLSKIRKLLSF